MALKTDGHPALKNVATDLDNGEDVTSIVSRMWSVMTHERGIGLANNQVGGSKRIIVVHANGFRQEFINPVITKRYGGKTTSREGCLSFPGLNVSVVRDKQIIVEGFDHKWKPIKFKLKGLASCCVQHEIDHLDGITIKDHLNKKKN